MAKKLKAEVDFLSLRRNKNTAPQTGLGKKQREQNVKNAFKLEKGNGIKGRNILLVDDVSTTGNTLNACSKTLRKGRRPQDLLCHAGTGRGLLMEIAEFFLFSKAEMDR